MTGLTIFNRPPVSRRNDFVDFYNMIDDFFGDSSLSRTARAEAFKMDLKENDDNYTIEAELPGIAKENIKISFDEGTLYIGVEQEASKDEEKGNYIYRERTCSSMARSVHLRDIDIDKIDAKLEEGILTIIVPKLELVEKKKQIEVK